MMITKRKATKIIKKWMKAYGDFICSELEIAEFEDECDQILEWIKEMKE